MHRRGYDELDFLIGENTFMLLSKYKSIDILSPNHFYLLRLKIVTVFFSSMALRLGQECRGRNGRRCRTPSLATSLPAHRGDPSREQEGGCQADRLRSGSRRCDLLGAPQ